jgi:hypothetical protein
MTKRAEFIAFYELTQAKAKYCRTLDTQDWQWPSGWVVLLTLSTEN